MRWMATVALLVVLADCSGAAQYGVDRPAPAGSKPELACANTSACLTALPVPAGTTRRSP
jgi:hypothetical protein